MKKLLIAAALALLLPVGGALASGDHDKGPNGGVIEENGPLHVELVKGASDLKLYIYDGKMKPLNTAGSKAKATVLVNQKQEEVPLTLAQPNGFQGSYALATGARLVVEVEMPGKRPVMVRFSVK